MNWQFLNRFEFVEVWRTPTRYLSCYHYGGIYHFCSSYEEALKVAKQILDENKISQYNIIMKFELSNLLNRNIDKIKKLNSKRELEVFVKRLILDNNLTKDKTSVLILKQLEKSKDFNSSQQVVWNALISSSGAFIGKEKTKNSWYKGTAIAGMECHSH